MKMKEENLRVAQETDDVSWASFLFGSHPHPVVVVVVVVAPKSVVNNIKIRENLHT